MNKLARYASKTLAIFLGSAAICLCSSSIARAETGPGSYSGGSCSGGVSYCYHGAAWVKYNIYQNMSGAVYLPNARDVWSSDRLVQVSKCRKYGYVYALVRFETAGGSGNFTGYGATSTQVKHVRWTDEQRNVKVSDPVNGSKHYLFYNYSASDTSPYIRNYEGFKDYVGSRGSRTNPLRAEADGEPVNPKNAWKAYDLMVRKYRDNLDEVFSTDSSGRRIMWDSENSTIGWFCYDGGVISEEFVSRSEVSWPELHPDGKAKIEKGSIKTQDNGKPYDDTKVEKEPDGTPKVVKELEIPYSQESVDLTFTHYAILPITDKDVSGTYNKIKDAGVSVDYNVYQYRYESSGDTPISSGKVKVSKMDKVPDHKRYRAETYSKPVTVKLNPNDTKLICQRNEIKPTEVTLKSKNNGYAIDSQEGTDYSQICVRVHRQNKTEPDPVQGSFYSQSGVNSTISNKDQTNARANPYKITLEADQGSAVVNFFHKIGSDVSSDVFDKASRAGAYTDWTVSQTSYQSNPRVSSGRTYISSLSQDGSTRNQIVYSNSVTVSVNQRQTVTVCQKIEYRAKNFTITSSGAFSPTNNTSGASSICIQVYRKPPVRRCSDIFPGQYDHTTNYGNTVAKSEAINYTNTTGYATWKDMVLAKPGDEIQFRHTLCFGAQAVTSSGYESSSYENTRRRPSTSFSYFPANWFYLSGYRDDDYLFNRNDLAYTKEIPKANSNPTSFYNQIHPEEIFTDYGFRLYSPKNPSVPGGATSYSNNQYNCALYGSGWTGGFLPNTYQIPGFSYSKCPRPGATDVAVNNSDVGNSVAQTMWYLNLKAWIKYRNNRTNASCGCDTKNEAYSWSLSYSSARSGGWGYWGYARQDCLYNGTCSCNCYYRDSCYSSTNGWYGCNWKCDTCDRHKQDYHYNGPSTRGDGVGYELALDYYTDTTTATVKVPYNFDTEVKAEITSGDGVGGAIYAGEQVRSSTEIKVESRLNRRINGDYAYLTHTPSDTRTEVISFTIGGDLDSATASSLLKGGVVSASSVSDYYNRRLGTYGYKLRSFLTTPYTGIVNGEGQLNGEVEAPGTGRWSEPIPDIEVGSKYCVAVGISHADSHGLPNQMIPNDENSAANSLSMGSTNPLWRISSASCRTIAKKPNFQAWGGLYAQGKVATSRSPKRDADSKAVARVITRLGGDAGKLFGSWSDTLAIAGGQITGLASGATLGYNNTGGGADPASLDSNYCALTPMSIANKYCSSRVSGSVGNIPISTTSLLDRIASRYTLKNNPSSGTTQFINDGNVLYSYYRGNKNITSSDVDPGSFDKKTRVIKVDGDITISSNICVENNGTCRYTGNNSLVLDQRNHRLYSGAEELSQVIIIASGNISISPDVTQIDAWLFANNGVINTCSAANYLNTNANTCNKTIIFNGPVFAKRLELNRTAGAYPGPNDVGAATIYNDLASSDRWSRNNESMTSNLKYGSLTPAEIFNLRPDVYYWGYNQSNRLTQATVTYIRELAPRY